MCAVNGNAGHPELALQQAPCADAELDRIGRGDGFAGICAANVHITDLEGKVQAIGKRQPRVSQRGAHRKAVKPRDGRFRLAADPVSPDTGIDGQPPAGQRNGHEQREKKDGSSGPARKAARAMKPLSRPSRTHRGWQGIERRQVASSEANARMGMLRVRPVLIHAFLPRRRIPEWHYNRFADS